MARSRAVLAVLAAIAVAVTGCATPKPVDSGPTPMSSASLQAQSVAACQAVEKATTTYRPKLSLEPAAASADGRVFRSWSTEVTKAAASVDDPVLKAELFALADTLYGWITRQPSDVQLLGYADNVGRACDKVLRPSPSPTA